MRQFEESIVFGISEGEDHPNDASGLIHCDDDETRGAENPEVKQSEYVWKKPKCQLLNHQLSVVESSSHTRRDVFSDWIPDGVARPGVTHARRRTRSAGCISQLPRSFRFTTMILAIYQKYE